MVPACFQNQEPFVAREQQSLILRWLELFSCELSEYSTFYSGKGNSRLLVHLFLLLHRGPSRVELSVLLLFFQGIVGASHRSQS